MTRLPHPERDPRNGRPYYCLICGLGFGEFMACEEPYCRLETEANAQQRRESWLAAEAEHAQRNRRTAQ